MRMYFPALSSPIKKEKEAVSEEKEGDGRSCQGMTRGRVKRGLFYINRAMPLS